jgi:hypothetical protein
MSSQLPHLALTCFSRQGFPNAWRATKQDDNSLSYAWVRLELIRSFLKPAYLFVEQSHRIFPYYAFLCRQMRTQGPSLLEEELDS